MFSRETDASKVALVHLVARLRVGGYRLLDCQFITEHLARFGTVEVARGAYKEMLLRALAGRGDFYFFGGAGTTIGGAAVLQSITQTS
jgi:leucyl/phenylalanyl-tRNA--protein transferase